MAKDDYDIIVYRVLVYLYACLKRRILFDEAIFRATVRKDIESEEYFTKALEMMQEEKLIRGLEFAHSGNISVLVSDIKETEITPDGIHYLKENSRMEKIGEALKKAVDIIADIAGLL
ncbi:MAG: hypothetical protein IJI45_09725 [Anaerolineaceae bacterium]|nr:hypothetical protein [Anaerolineaceae bacterium]